MGFLQGKKILITGMISERSIAYGIAKACREQGADLAFTYVVDKLEERVRKMAAELDSELVFRCDVASDDEINQVFADLGKHWDGLDGLVHSIGFAPKEALSGDFLDSISREAFNTAHEISAYSLPALAKAARPMMRGRNSAIVALSYLGAVRAIPNYNVMGMAKASLEAGIRFTAACLGKEGIRCNGISMRPDQNACRLRHRRFRQTLGTRRRPQSAAPQRYHRRSRQYRRLPAVRPVVRHYRRNHLR